MIERSFSSLAWLTFKDLSGHRTYRLSLLAVLLIPWFLMVPASLFLIDMGKVLLDMLFTGLHGWLFAYIFFIATPMIARDIELGIANIFLTLPMRRTTYYGARFIGLLGGMIPLFTLYLLSSLLTIFWASHAWQGYIPNTLWLSGMEGMLLICLPYISLMGILFLIASRATGAAEISVFLVAVWILCWSIPPVLEALQHPDVLSKTSPWLVALLETVHQFLPDLTSSQISLRLAHELPLDIGQVLGYCAQHLSYTTLAWLTGAVLFIKRDLS